MRRTIRADVVIRVSDVDPRWCHGFCTFRSDDRCWLFLTRDDSLRALRVAADNVNRFRCRLCMQAEVTA